MSKHSSAIKEAYSMGYRVDSAGVVFLNGRRINTSISANGYVMFSFCSATVGWQRISVSKFAGFQEFGEAALGELCEVRHLNGNPIDNRLANLQIGTPTENRMDILPNTRKRIACTAAAKLRKLTIDAAEDLRKDNLNGISLKRLAEKYGISKTAASYIVNHKTYCRYPGGATK